MLQIVIHLNKEGLIERISGMEQLKELSGYKKLKVLQGIRNKFEREIFSIMARLKPDSSSAKDEKSLRPISDKGSDKGPK